MGADKAGDHLPRGPTGSATQASAFSDSAEVFSGPSWSPESSGEMPDHREFLNKATKVSKRRQLGRDAIKLCMH